MVPLATHPYGCRVVKRVLEHANATQCRRLMREVLSSTCHLEQVSSVCVCVYLGGGGGGVSVCVCVWCVCMSVCL